MFVIPPGQARGCQVHGKISGHPPTIYGGVFGKQKLLAKGLAVLNGFATFTQLCDHPTQYTSMILVANLADHPIHIPQGMRLAYVDVKVTPYDNIPSAIGVIETQPVPDVLQHGVNHRLKDIRLNPYYLQWISSTLGCNLELFQTAFYTGGEYRDQCWTNTRVWVNPLGFISLGQLPSYSKINLLSLSS